MRNAHGIHMAALSGLVAVSIGGLAFAHSGATGIVKQRMESMKSIAGSMKTISKLTWTKPNEARLALKKNAAAIGKHASQIVKMFPEGSIEEPSEALSAIWEKPDEFARLAEAMESRAGELAALAPEVSSGDEIKPRLASLGETCKTCHEGFRKKK
ncbi:MAG: c-type cytochrome [Rhizobiaceae bacterium]